MESSRGEGLQSVNTFSNNFTVYGTFSRLQDRTIDGRQIEENASIEVKMPTGKAESAMFPTTTFSDETFIRRGNQKYPGANTKLELLRTHAHKLNK